MHALLHLNEFKYVLKLHLVLFLAWHQNITPTYFNANINPLYGTVFKKSYIFAFGVKLGKLGKFVML